MAQCKHVNTTHARGEVGARAVHASKLERGPKHIRAVPRGVCAGGGEGGGGGRCVMPTRAGGGGGGGARKQTGERKRRGAGRRGAAARRRACVCAGGWGERKAWGGRVGAGAWGIVGWVGGWAGGALPLAHARDRAARPDTCSHKVIVIVIRGVIVDLLIQAWGSERGEGGGWAGWAGGSVGRQRVEAGAGAAPPLYAPLTAPRAHCPHPHPGTPHHAPIRTPLPSPSPHHTHTTHTRRKLTRRAALAHVERPPPPLALLAASGRSCLFLLELVGAQACVAGECECVSA